MRLELDEVRRLTGPNLLWDEPGAIADVWIDGIDSQKVIATWQHWFNQIQQQFGWQERTAFRIFDGGASLAVSAPMDALYTACELAELAWDCASAELTEQSLPDWQARLDELRGELEEERNPALLALMQAAQQQGVTCISDDDEVSLGMGESVDVWPARELPDVEDVNWSKYQDVPIALITGTNGKSTSVRLATVIAREAGINAGVTSTDFIKVGDHIIDEGDYSGPGGARMLLRDRRTQMAFLEVARGGILRRGLPVTHVNVALVTNVASDHLGQYGINTVDELAEAKFVVAKGLGGKNPLVLNADNATVVKQSVHVDAPICWFSTDQLNPLIQQQLQYGRRAVYVDDGAIVYSEKGQSVTLCKIDDIPMTFGGSATHNVQNALGVVGLCMALGIDQQAIVRGLMTFGSDEKDNPGRSNRYDVKGVSVFVDFAHNEHSMTAVVNMVARMPAKKRIVMFGHAGDRSDEDIQALTNAVMAMHPHHIIVSELEHYLRGRELGDIPAVVTKYLAEHGVDASRVSVAEDPSHGAELALSLAEPGDSVLLFTLDQRDQVQEILRQHQCS